MIVDLIRNDLSMVATNVKVEKFSGIFDGENLNFAAMIRSIEKNGEKYIFKSGGGITAQRDPELEYQELIDKVYVPVY